MAVAAPAMFVTFGKVSSPLTALEREGAACAAVAGPDAPGFLGRQVALIDQGMPAIRLNTPGWLSAPPSLVAALTHRADLRLLCRDRLQGLTPPFAARASRWIERYLLAAAKAAAPPQDTGDITEAGDRYFATLLPLVAAHLTCVDRKDGVLLSTRADQGFVSLDLVLWDGMKLTGLLFGGTAARTPRQNQTLAKLAKRLGNRLHLQELESPADEDAAIGTLIAQQEKAPQPWFGPYRAEGFRGPLPIEPAERKCHAFAE